MLYSSPMTTVTVSSKYQIVIPQEARKKLGIKAGMRLQATSGDLGLRLVREPEIDEIAGLLKGMIVDNTATRSEEDRVVS